ncbi:DUF6933 domain-containing protein [Trichloromonas sp.]|uniref:DUF6933 domain-containing protein n=1 Tax=Trichloromonas sp. TaxID=3069249 RepID=UPI003D81619E
MLLHCTKKLTVKLPDISSSPLGEKSLLGSWHGHLVQIARRQCVLFCHDETRYMLFVPGVKKPHFEDLGRVHRDLFLMSLAAQGVPDAKIMRAGMALGPAAFDGATDRSVLASMNVALGDLGAYLLEYPNLLEIDLAATAVYLNDRPVSVRGAWHWPTKKMLAMVAKL